MKRIETINNIIMVQQGDYNWRVLKENDGTEIYQIVISATEKQRLKGYTDSTLVYDTKAKILSVRKFMQFINGNGDFFCFKIDFKDSPIFVKSLLEGEMGKLAPIYHKDTVKVKIK